ncbi:MAG: radical SAM protein [Candidatus Parcubacteria bacterium]|nr:radical SAM protein [Candidatus Parcubacteria bacterium]
MASRKGARLIYTFNERWTSIFTSRGCPYNCNFCTINLTMGRQFRQRSPENVLAEIKQVCHDYNIKHINFEDDNLTLDKKRAERIFDLMIKNKLNITWSTPNGIRVENIDDGLVQKMKKSGCRRVFVAPESGVQRVVTEIIGKNLDLKKIEQAVIIFKKYGIIVDGSFVIGHIGETKKEIWKTILFALKLKKLGMNTAGFHIATPYYGTRLYEEAKQKGYLRKDFDENLLSTREPLIITPEWNQFQIKRMHKIANWLINYSFKEKIIAILPVSCQILASRIKQKCLKIIYGDF